MVRIIGELCDCHLEEEVIESKESLENEDDRSMNSEYSFIPPSMNFLKEGESIHKIRDNCVHLMRVEKSKSLNALVIKDAQNVK